MRVTRAARKRIVRPASKLEPHDNGGATRMCAPSAGSSRGAHPAYDACKITLRAPIPATTIHDA